MIALEMKNRLGCILIVFFSFFTAGCFLNASMSKTSLTSGSTLTDPEPSPPTPGDPGDTPEVNSPKLKQISQIGHMASATDIVEMGGKLFFPGGDNTHGRELWSFDFTSQNFQLVKDIYPGIIPSNPRQLTIANGMIYFFALDIESGLDQLWRTDGTSAGTIRLTNLPLVGIFTLIYPTSFGVLFGADDGVHGFELWRSNGTNVGTYMVKDIDGTPGPSWNGFGLVELAGEYYFSATHPATGNELWKTNGTEIGTVLVHDIEVGTASSAPSDFKKVGTRIIFTAETTVEGREMWATDGTTTNILKNIRAGSLHSNIQPAVVAGNKAYFVAREVGSYEMWVTDGTPGGTVKLSTVVMYQSSIPAILSTTHIFLIGTKGGQTGVHAYDLNTSVETFVGSKLTLGAPSYVEMGGYLYIVLSDGVLGFELHRINLTTLATNIVKDIHPVNTQVGVLSVSKFDNTRLFLMANNGTNGLEPWLSDGTSAGTFMIKDIRSGAYNSGLSVFANNINGGQFYFVASTGINDLPKIWSTDGTAGNTLALNESPIVSGASASVALGLFPINSNKFLSTLYTTNFGHEVWCIDAQAETVSLTKDVNPDESATSVAHLFSFLVHQGKLYFNALDSVGGETVWSTDGSTAGTNLVVDTDTGSTAIAWIKFFGGDSSNMYFYGTDSVNGGELWKTDGTTIGSSLVENITPGATGTGFVGPSVSLNGLSFIAVTTAGEGTELWQTDGTSAGTQLFKEFKSGTGSGLGSSGFSGVTINNIHYFAADDGTNGMELWRSDGTLAGTQLVKDINTLAGHSNPTWYTSFGNKFLFVANDGVNGAELWISDGTTAGTTLLKEITPTAAGTTVFRSVKISDAGIDKIIFFANNGAAGMEPWVTDGTTDGTFLLKDIGPGVAGVVNSELVAVGKYAYFLENDGINGTEIWRTDGTSDGTKLYYETIPGPKFLEIKGLISSAGKLFIYGTSPILTFEWFVLENQ